MQFFSKVLIYFAAQCVSVFSVFIEKPHEKGLSEAHVALDKYELNWTE